MELAIAIFAWIGFGAVVSLSVGTAFVWLMCLQEHVTEYAGKQRGLWEMGLFFMCMWAVKAGDAHDITCAKHLLRGYRELQKTKPEVAGMFEKALAEPDAGLNLEI